MAILPVRRILVHYPLLVMLGRAIPVLRTGSTVLDVLVYSVLLVPVVILAGVCLFVVVERPCMDPTWAPRLWRRSHRRQPLDGRPGMYP